LFVSWTIGGSIVSYFFCYCYLGADLTPFKSMFFSNWCPYRIVSLSLRPYDFCDYSSSIDWKLLMAPHDDDNGTQLSCAVFVFLCSSFFVMYRKFQKPQFFYFTIDAVNMDFFFAHTQVFIKLLFWKTMIDTWGALWIHKVSLMEFFAFHFLSAG